MEWLMVFALALLLSLLLMSTLVVISGFHRTAGPLRTEWSRRGIKSAGTHEPVRLRRWIFDIERGRIVVIVVGLLVAADAVAQFWKRPHDLLPLLALIGAAVCAANLLPGWLAGSLTVAGGILAARALPGTLLLSGILATGGCTLLLLEMILARRATRAVEARFQALLEASPSPVVFVGKNGFIEIANAAAQRCLQPRSGSVVGDPLAAFLPDLDRVLRYEEYTHSVASLKCRGRRDRDEGSFTAQVHFARFKEDITDKLVAFIANVEDHEEVSASTPQLHGTLSHLTDRENAVTHFLCQGLANKEIAGMLDVSEGTIKNTMHHLFEKRKVRTRSQFVRSVIEGQSDSSRVIVFGAKDNRRSA